MKSLKTLFAVLGIVYLALSLSFAQESPKDHNLDEIYAMVGYPEHAREAGIEGSVQLRVLIDQQGRYVRHEVQYEAHRWLTEACVAAIPNLRLPKGSLEGKPMMYWVSVPFSFYLPDDPESEGKMDGE